MKPPKEMTAEELLNKYIGSWSVSITDAGKTPPLEVRQRAAEAHKKLHDELLARLNAGGSLKDRISELLKLASGPENGPSEEAVFDAVKALLSRGASQPLQPRCPKEGE